LGIKTLQWTIKMNHLITLTTLLVVRVSYSLEETPNIMFIMADQLRFDALSEELSPNLSNLKSTGYNFLHAYTSTPTCTPARAAILTGRSPWYHGMLGYDDIAKHYPQGEYPELLAASGYALHSIGKNHFGWDKKLDQGEAHSFNSTNIYDGLGNGMPDGSEYDDYDRWFQEQKPGEDPLKNIDDWNSWHALLYPYETFYHPTAWTGRNAVNFLNDYANISQTSSAPPFFLKVSFHRPHSPYDPPVEYFKKVTDDLVNPPYAGGNWDERYKGPDHDCGPKHFDAWCGEMPLNETLFSRKSYLANVKFIDDQVGDIIDSLEQNGLKENTFILFTADHGDGQGDHYHWRKGFPYEFSSHIPMILWASNSGASSSHDIDEPVELRDLFPTFLDIAGASDLIPSDLNGSSLINLIPKLRSKLHLTDLTSEPWREWIDLEHNICYNTTMHWNALTDGKIKYVYRAYFDDEQLFNMTADPKEMESLHDKPEYAEELELWRGRMVQQFEDEERGEKWVKDGILQRRVEGQDRSPYYPKNIQRNDIEVEIEII